MDFFRLCFERISWVHGFLAIVTISILKRIFRRDPLKHLPGPKGVPIFGNLFQVGGTDRLHFFFRDCARKFGENFQVAPFGQTTVILTNPDDVKKVLVTKNFPKSPIYDGFSSPDNSMGHLFSSKGQVWKRQRRALNPMFNETSVRTLFPIFHSHASTLLQTLSDLSSAKQLVNVDDLMSTVTLDVLLDTAFGMPRTDERKSDLIKALRQAINTLTYVVQIPGLFTLYQAAFFFGLARSPALEFAMNVVKERQEAKRTGKDGAEGRRDMLDMLLEATDEDGKPLSDKELRDQVFIFFIAGHDTTAHTLSWTLYLLAKNSDAASKAREELDGVLGDKALPTVDDLRDLPYLNAIIQESLRLKPVAASGTHRVTDESIELSCGKLPKGTKLCVCPAASHFQKGLWGEDVDDFKPERFLPLSGEKAPHPVQAFLPFSLGARDCIGKSFALLEMRLLLATMLRSFEFELDESQGPVEEKYGITMKPRNGVWMKIRPRAEK